MTAIPAKLVKKLRDETGAPVMEVRKALLHSKGDEKRAKEIIKESGIERVSKRAGRVVGQGLIETYIHADGNIGAMVYLACETDFVARTEEFKKLAKEVAMQVASMDPKDVAELLDQEYIREPEKKVSELVGEVAAKTGENVQVKKITRFSLGE